MFLLPLATPFTDIGTTVTEKDSVRRENKHSQLWCAESIGIFLREMTKRRVNSRDLEDANWRNDQFFRRPVGKDDNSAALLRKFLSGCGPNRAPYRG